MEIYIGNRDAMTEVGPNLTPEARKLSQATKALILSVGRPVPHDLEITIDREAATGRHGEAEALAIHALQVRADEIVDVIERETEEAEERRRELNATRRAINESRKERLHAEWIAQHIQGLADLRAAEKDEPCQT
jgi:hypothetical protein